MRKCIVIVFIPLFLYACGASDEVRVEKTESREFSSSQIREIELKTENGVVKGNARSGDSIYVVFDKWATGNDREDAEDNLKDIEILITEDTASEVLIIDVDIPDNTTIDYGSDVSIEFPASTELELRSSNGSITIEDTDGDAKLRTSNGKITVRNHYGNLDGETSNGEIDVDIVLPDDGDCKLKTSNGNIVLSIPGSTSADIEASTSNGEIETRSLDFDNVESTDREFEGKMGDGDGDIELETSNGNILIKER